MRDREGKRRQEHQWKEGAYGWIAVTVEATGAEILIPFPMQARRKAAAARSSILTLTEVIV